MTKNVTKTFDYMLRDTKPYDAFMIKFIHACTYGGLADKKQYVLGGSDPFYQFTLIMPRDDILLIVDLVIEASKFEKNTAAIIKILEYINL